MKLNALIPKPLKKVSFTMASRMAVPEVFGAYAILSFDDQVLYVGKATSIRNRMMCHLEDEKKLIESKHGIGFWFCFIETKNVLEAETIEHGWLNCSMLTDGGLPCFNKVYA